MLPVCPRARLDHEDENGCRIVIGSDVLLVYVKVVMTYKLEHSCFHCI